MTDAVQVVKLREGARLPRYASAGAAGMDLAACVDEPLVLAPGAFARVPTGIAIALPVGTEAQVRPRSGLAARHAVTVLNAPGTIDCDYRGEVQVLLINHGSEPFTIQDGERIAQMVIAAAPQYLIVEAESLDATERAEGGFGSTGMA
ncbi:MAG: dUTP pyrophosphatase [Polyangiales bacterium]|jgi:dUTP pyrophosphatase